MTTREFLSYLRSLDVKLWADGDRIRYSAPNGVLTPDLYAELAERKADILALSAAGTLCHIFRTAAHRTCRTRQRLASVLCPTAAVVS